MLPRERRPAGQNDLFRSQLDQIVDMKHKLAKLAGHVDWFLEKTFGAAYSDRRASPLAGASDGGAFDPQAHLQPV